MQILREISRTFGEYLLVPNLTDQDCTPERVDLSAPLVRHRVGQAPALKISIPMVSAIMEAVSSPRLAIALAQVGGLAFIHQNQTIQEQARDVRAVKLSDADSLPWDHRLDVLPVVETDGRLASVVLRRDCEVHKQFNNETIDDEKQFMVGAGVNTRDYRERIPALVEAGADILCLDSSDGYSVWQREVLLWVREKYGDTVRIGAGNVVDGRGFRYLAEAGADFVKVGIGGGSICITRDQKGIGRGQASALADVVAERDAYAQQTGEYVPVCSDGGVLHDSHMSIALAFGTDFLMLGRYFARFDESPSALVHVDGQLFKEYWGEGSQRARNTDRYGHSEAGPGEKMLFEEGVDGVVPYTGSLYASVSVTLAKIRSTMVSCGSTSLRQFHGTATLVEVSHQSWMHNSEDVQLRNCPTS